MSSSSRAECEEPQLNGHGCAPLAIVEESVDRLRQRQNERDAQDGRWHASLSEAKLAAQQARDAALASDARVARIETYVFGPTNTVIAKYQSDAPLMSADDEENLPTSTTIQVPHLAERRIKREEVGRLAAEKRAEALGAEKERIRAAAALETARVEEAARLKTERLEREKRNTRLLHAAIGAIVALSTAVTTYLASRGH